MTSQEQPPPRGAASDSSALAKVVARQRAEIVDLQRVAALLPVLERAKGAVMVQEGCSAQEAYELLLDRSAAAGRTLVEECWLTLGAIRPARRRRGRRRRRPDTDSGGSVFDSAQYLVPAEPSTRSAPSPGPVEATPHPCWAGSAWASRVCGTATSWPAACWNTSPRVPRPMPC